MIDTAKNASGVVHLLRHAISDHRRRHFGDRPRSIGLHPQMRFALMLELQEMDWSTRHAMFHELNKPQPTFEGVPLVFMESVTWPKLITANNEVEYL